MIGSSGTSGLIETEQLIDHRVWLYGDDGFEDSVYGVPNRQIQVREM